MANAGRPLVDYVEVGDGRPLLFIPGMEGAKEFWMHQLDRFGQSYRAIGCSYPRRVPSRRTSIHAYVDEFVRLLDHLEIEKAAVVGESMGGLIAQHLAIAFPERVAALILCNTLASASRFQPGLNASTLATAAYPLAFLAPRRVQKSFLRWVGRNRGFVMDPSAGNEQLAEYLLEFGLAPGFGGYADRLVSLIRGTSASGLASIRAPTLVVRGTEDRLIGDESRVELVGRIAHAELVLVDGGGHCCQYTLPDPTNRALLGWLRRIQY